MCPSTGAAMPATDPHLTQARAELRRGLQWAAQELETATGAEAFLVIAWQLEQATAATRHLAIHALDDAGYSAAEIGDLPGVWLPAEQVVADVLPHRSA